MWTRESLPSSVSVENVTEFKTPGRRRIEGDARCARSSIHERLGEPLTPQMVAEGVLTIARGAGPAGPAIGITGSSGLEAILR